MKFKSVVVTRRGGPEVLQVVENDLRYPSAGEVRIKILATPVVQDDIAVREGNRPFLAKTPFVTGYSILGIVDATGDGVSQVAVGDRVAALTNFGGYAEYIYWDAEQLVHVPMFKLLGEGDIKPIVAARYPIPEAASANELLESGQVTGNVVLLSPELLGSADNRT